jgi:conjugative relaxase-like TrwC/TraI family protein
LEGEVDGDAFRRVLAHADPYTGRRLTDGHSDPKVVGIDATFCAPKSVSLFHALGRGEMSNEVGNAHDAAVRAAVEFYEQAAQGRRGKAGITTVEGDGFVAAAYRHRTSRAAEPHLHTHVVIANLVHAASDGRWSALDGRPVFAWARAVGHLYNAHLRAELTARLGVRWQPICNGVADVDGIDRSTIDVFSTRRRQIEAAMDRAGAHSAKAAQTAAYRTRTPKDLSLDAQTLIGQWRALAARHGLTAASLDGLCEPTVTRPSVPVLGSSEADAMFEHLASPAGLTAKRSTFDARHVIEAICELLPQGGRVEEVVELAARFLASEHVRVLDGPQLTRPVSLRRGDRRLVPAGDGLCRYTTPEMIQTERHLLGRAVARRFEHTAVVPAAFVDLAIAARPTLAPEQRAMVRGVCVSGDGVDVVRGVAGAGKTYALAAAADAFRAGGHPIVGCALAAKAAARLEDATGIPSMSVDRMLYGLDRGRAAFPVGQVVVVDEAAMVGTRKLHRLLDYAEQWRTKVVLIGDPCQLPEIEAGGAFAALERTLGASEVSNNRRQVEAWERQALQHLRNGDVEAALDLYHGMSRIHETGDTRDRLVRDWVAARRDSADVVMLAATRAEVDDLNHRARHVLRERGQLGPDVAVIAGRGLAVGDAVLALRNDYPHDLLNGTRLQVTGVDRATRRLRAVDDLDRRVNIDFAYIEAGHLAHAYAMTIHKTQGATVEQAFVLAQPETFTAELGYTALSRASHGTNLYIDDAITTRETHARQRVQPAAVDRLTASLRRAMREPLAIDQGPTTLQPVAALRVERDRLLRQLGPRPADHTRQLAVLDHDIRMTRETRRQALTRIHNLQCELEAVGPISRRLHPERHRDITRQLDHTCGVAVECAENLEQLAGEHRKLTIEQRAVQRWEHTHAPELQRLDQLDRHIRIGVRLERTATPTVARPGPGRGLGLGL